MKRSLFKVPSSLLEKALRNHATLCGLRSRATDHALTFGRVLRYVHVNPHAEGWRGFLSSKTESSANSITRKSLIVGCVKCSRFISSCAISNSDKNDVSSRLSLPENVSWQDETVDTQLMSDESVESIANENSLPEMSRTVYNLAPYVQQSQVLQNLVKLGVDLTKLEKVKGIANMLLVSDFDRDILPYLRHLARVGVAPDQLGRVLTINPMILTEHLEDLEERVGYMISKDLAMQDVASVYTRAPVVLRMDPSRLESKWSFLQASFGLSDLEIKQVVLTFPKILPWRADKINDIRHTLKEFLGFEEDELLLMILKEPKIFTTNKYRVQKVFDFIHNTMLIPHSLIVKHPSSLRTRLHRLQERHLFLVHLGKAQYDPCKENYISLTALLGCPDNNFCTDVAKSTDEAFRTFLKLL